MSEENSKTFMNVVNFRYGGRPVERVYLGSKLIWWRENVAGTNMVKSNTRSFAHRLAPQILKTEE